MNFERMDFGNAVILHCIVLFMCCTFLLKSEFSQNESFVEEHEGALYPSMAHAIHGWAFELSPLDDPSNFY